MVKLLLEYGAKPKRIDALGKMAHELTRGDEAIALLLSNSPVPKDAVVSIESSPPGEDVVSGLERLAKLHGNGSITLEEFTLAKSQLLARQSS